MITVSTESYISGPTAVITLPNIPKGQYEVTIVLRPKRKKPVAKKPQQIMSSDEIFNLYPIRRSW